MSFLPFTDSRGWVTGSTLTLTRILAPFIYGGFVAYLLRPLCNKYESFLLDTLPWKLKKASSSLAVGMSLITGILIVYALIIMIAPQLFKSVMSLWDTTTLRS